MRTFCEYVKANDDIEVAIILAEAQITPYQAVYFVFQDDPDVEPYLRENVNIIEGPLGTLAGAGLGAGIGGVPGAMIGGVAGNWLGDKAGGLIKRGIRWGADKLRNWLDNSEVSGYVKQLEQLRGLYRALGKEKELDQMLDQIKNSNTSSGQNASGQNSGQINQEDLMKALQAMRAQRQQARMQRQQGKPITASAPTTSQWNTSTSTADDYIVQNGQIQGRRNNARQ